MIEIEWEEYCSATHLKNATDEMLDKNENDQWVGRKLPEGLRKIMKEHGGESPINLIPIYPNGKKMIIECVYHAHIDDDDYV